MAKAVEMRPELAEACKAAAALTASGLNVLLATGDVARGCSRNDQIAAVKAAGGVPHRVTYGWRECFDRGEYADQLRVYHAIVIERSGDGS